VLALALGIAQHLLQAFFLLFELLLLLCEAFDLQIQRGLFFGASVSGSGGCCCCCGGGVGHPGRCGIGPGPRGRRCEGLSTRGSCVIGGGCHGCDGRGAPCVELCEPDA
jgi:hypothetical protein